MEIKLNYKQLLNLVKQLPAEQIEKLFEETRHLLAKRKKEPDTQSFQEFLLSAPSMTDKQYESFLENRKRFNEWRNR